MMPATEANAAVGALRYSGRRAPIRTRIRHWIVTPSGAVVVLLIVLLAALFAINPELAVQGHLPRFIGRSAPLAIVALGQYFVIVSGELDLSIGAVIAAQVVLAGNVIGQDDALILPVLGLMVLLAVVIGLVNGLIVTFLKVPSFIATLGTALVISGLTFFATGGAPSGNPTDTFRAIGRGGIELPMVGFLPYSVILLAVLLAVSVALMRSPFGRMLLSSGDNPRATALTGASVPRLRTSAFVLSALSASIAAVLLIGYAGVSPVVGRGYEFTAITAVVLGGVVLGGGRGRVVSAFAGAFVLQVLFSLLNFLGVATTWQSAVQGAIIVLAIGLPLVRWGGLRTMVRRRHGAAIDSVGEGPLGRPSTEIGEIADREKAAAGDDAGRGKE